ncbi:hypothetical protein M5K25_012468 [Dendrobium thyrsiflorum]|uniref:Secreted protein n=1 Tax=Dendrobium thyrsiflorum TaxID=117978 RepID=A0ABD0UX81_DENTH
MFFFFYTESHLCSACTAASNSRCVSHGEATFPGAGWLFPGELKWIEFAGREVGIGRGIFRSFWKVWCFSRHRSFAFRVPSLCLCCGVNFNVAPATLNFIIVRLVAYAEAFCGLMANDTLSYHLAGEDLNPFIIAVQQFTS